MKRVISLAIFLSFVFMFVSCDNDNKNSGGESSVSDSDSIDAAQDEDDESDVDAKITSTGDFIISNVAVSRNPNSEISCIVTWKTDTPSDSVVEFGTESEGIKYRIKKSVSVTEHRVAVIGMSDDSDHLLKVISNDGDKKSESSIFKFRTGKLPEFLPLPEITVNKKDKINPGWTLMTVNAGKVAPLPKGGEMDPEFTSTAVMYNNDGKVMWYRVHGLNFLPDTTFTPDGNILVATMQYITDEEEPSAVEFDLEGNAVWRGPDQPMNVLLDGRYHHYYEKLENGNYFSVKHFIKNFETDNSVEVKVIGDLLVEMDDKHNVVWEWNVFDHIEPENVEDFIQYGYYDWTHSNSAVHTEYFVYLNARHLNTVLKIEKSTGQIVWQLGVDKDFAADPDSENPWQLLPHGLELLENGNFIFYDNGTESIRAFTRALEIEVDEENMEAKIVWEYDGGESDKWQTESLGDADRLENGNTLISAGTWDVETNTRVFEVTKEGEKVWEADFKPRGEFGVSMYSSEKIPALVETIE